MIDRNEIDSVIGRDVCDNDGNKIGRAGQVYLDDQTGDPEWVTVLTGLFGTNESFVPLRDAQLSGDTLTVGYTKEKVKDAPNVDPQGGHLDVEEERRLFEYYGVRSAADAGTRPGRGTEEVYDAEGRDQTYRAAETGGDRDTRRSAETDAGEVTLAEERAQVGTQEREAGRARLRKYVVTEQQTTTVPVRREEVRLEREPVGESSARDVDSDSAFTEEEQEVVLREEVPVVEKEVVPTEKVRLSKDTVTDEHTVTEDVRKEEVAAEGVDSEGRPKGSGRQA